VRAGRNTNDIMLTFAYLINTEHFKLFTLNLSMRLVPSGALRKLHALVDIFISYEFNDTNA